jgi:predicted PurR-regulated permease PerM
MPEGWLSRERALALVLIAATALALAICSLLVRPFLSALAWALALAVVTHPVYKWLLSRVGRPNLAAGLAVVLVSILLIAPALFVLTSLAREVAEGVERLQTEAATGRWRDLIERNPRLAPALHWLETHIDISGEVRRAVTMFTARLPSFVTGSLWAGIELLIILFLLFYFFRDRHVALRGLQALMPLSEAETTEMFRRVADTVHATIYGTLVVAAVQGTLGGLMFWWLGLPTPLVWGMVMALLAVVPILGAFVVWIPAAVFLALEGHWAKALILTGWGGIVIALIDNLLYPVLVGERLRLHTLLVFIAILGGLTLFGASGLILGPVVLAVTLALVDVWRWRTAGGRSVESGVQA